MSKLSDMFKSMEGFWHHGPSMAPFHNAIIEAVDALKEEVAAFKAASVKREEELAAWVESIRAPKYITEEQAAPAPEPEAPAPAVEPVPQDAEPVAAAPAIKPADLPAQPDPVAAAPEAEDEPADEVDADADQSHVEGL